MISWNVRYSVLNIRLNILIKSLLKELKMIIPSKINIKNTIKTLLNRKIIIFFASIILLIKSQKR